MFALLVSVAFGKNCVQDCLAYRDPQTLGAVEYWEPICAMECIDNSDYINFVPPAQGRSVEGRLERIIAALEDETRQGRWKECYDECRNNGGKSGSCAFKCTGTRSSGDYEEPRQGRWKECYDEC